MVQGCYKKFLNTSLCEYVYLPLVPLMRQVAKIEQWLKLIEK